VWLLDRPVGDPPFASFVGSSHYRTVAADYHPARIDGFLFSGVVLFGLYDWICGSAAAAPPAIYVFATAASSIFVFSRSDILTCTFFPTTEHKGIIPTAIMAAKRPPKNSKKSVWPTQFYQTRQVAEITTYT